MARQRECPIGEHGSFATPCADKGDVQMAASSHDQRKRRKRSTHPALAQQPGLLLLLADDESGPVKTRRVLLEPFRDVLGPGRRQKVGEALPRLQIGVVGHDDSVVRVYHSSGWRWTGVNRVRI